MPIPRFAYMDLFPLDALYTYMPWDVILKRVLDILIFSWLQALHFPYCEKKHTLALQCLCNFIFGPGIWFPTASRVSTENGPVCGRQQAERKLEMFMVLVYQQSNWFSSMFPLWCDFHGWEFCLVGAKKKNDRLITAIQRVSVFHNFHLKASRFKL